MESIVIKEYLVPLLKWWWMIVLAVVLATAASGAYTLQQPALYRSRTQIMVGKDIIQGINVDNNQLWLAEQLAQSYKNIAERAAVREATMEALGMDWLPQYDVWVLPNTSLIDIYVTDTNPARAQQVGKELVTQLIQQSPAGREEEERQQFLNQQLQLLESNIIQTDEEIQRNSATLLEARSVREISKLENQVRVLEDKMSRLRATYGDLLDHSSQASINKIDLIEDASLPPAPISNDLYLNLLLAAIGGFVLSACGAYLIEFLDHSIKGSTDVSHHLNATIMGSVPEIEPGDVNGDERVVSFFGKMHPAAEAYRTLRTNLQFASVDSDLRTLLVTSPSPGDGKSTTVANLATALAHAGNKVAIVDVDLRRPTQHQFFRIYNNVGTTTALLSDTWNFDILMRDTPVASLKILPSGPLPPNPAELLGSERMKKLQTALLGEFDILLLDSPPITSVSDAIVLSTLVDSILLVVRSGKTRREEAKYAIERLRLVNAPLAGVLLNDVKQNSMAGTYYGYSSAYTSYGNSRKQRKRKSVFSFFSSRSRKGVNPVMGPPPGVQMRMPNGHIHSVVEGNTSYQVPNMNHVNSVGLKDEQK